MTAKAQRAVVGQMSTHVMDITPAQAAEFLKLNSSNRPVRPSWVRQLVAIIERDEWKLTHQGIAITADNSLLDGQHRLKAIVTAGKTVKMNVSFDCDPASFRVLDSGVRRTISDHLAVPAAVVSLARMLWALPRRVEKGPPTSAQVDAVLGWARDLIDEVINAGSGRSKRTSAPIQLAVCVHLMAGHQVIPAFIAFRGLDFDAMPAAVKVLTKQLIDGKTSARQDPWELAARAWRAFDPASTNFTKLQIKDVNSNVNEMIRAMEGYLRRRRIQVVQ